MHMDFEWRLKGIRTYNEQLMNGNGMERAVPLNGPETGSFLGTYVPYILSCLLHMHSPRISLSKSTSLRSRL